MEPVREADWLIPQPSCALDVADAVAIGETPPRLKHIGAWYGVTEQRVRQILSMAVNKVGVGLRRLDPDLPLIPPKSLRRKADESERQLVEILVRRAGWVPVSELARRLGLSEVGVHRVSRRLRQTGYPICGRNGHRGGLRWGAE